MPQVERSNFEYSQLVYLSYMIQPSASFNNYNRQQLNINIVELRIQRQMVAQQTSKKDRSKSENHNTNSLLYILIKPVLLQNLCLLTFLPTFLRNLSILFARRPRIKQNKKFLLLYYFKTVQERTDFFQQISETTTFLNGLRFGNLEQTLPIVGTPSSHLEIVYVSAAKNCFYLKKGLLTSLYFSIPHLHSKNLGDFRTHPTFELYGLLFNKLINLIVEFFAEALEHSRVELTSVGKVDGFPVGDLRIIIQFLQDLNFCKGPPVYFFSGRVEFDNNGGMVIFIQIESGDRILFDIFVSNGTAVGEPANFPKISFETSIRRHFKIIVKQLNRLLVQSRNNRTIILNFSLIYKIFRNFKFIFEEMLTVCSILYR